jgi:anti-anti-sigma regulatory factor
MIFDKIIINDIAIVKVNTARATIEKVPEFKLVIQEVLDENYTKVIIDLSVCEYLIFIQKKLKTVGQEIRLITVKDSLSTIFVITSMEKVFKKYISIEQAMESFL